MKYLTFLLLIGSNIFMTIAWYGHLKFKSHSLILTILISWGIALFEYALMIPANQIGYRYYSLTQLKIIQEVITLGVFIIFSWIVFKEPLKINQLYAMLCIIGAVYFIFQK